MEKINAELGKVVCDELAFNDAVATMITDITTVSSRAIKVLREHFKDEVTDDEATLCTFADTAKFEDFISTSRDSYLGNIKFVPFEEKDRVCRLYQELHDTCISFVKDLQRLYGLGYTLQYDGAKLIPDKAEIEKEIRKNFIVPLTDEQREYFTLIAAVHNAIADLNQFEQEHKLNEFSVHGYSDIKFGIYKKIEPFPYFLKFDEANYIDGLKTGMFFNED
jgi:hypothetical protein